MFFGRYEHTIDEKGRLTIPARYRELLENGAYVTRGFDNNLIVHPAASFEAMFSKVNQLSLTDPLARDLKRFIFSNTERCEIDRAGRILLPQFLRDVARLDGNALLIGSGSYFEIWSPANWATQDERMQESDLSQRFAAFDLPAV
jgi:MraZ protein